MEIIRFNKGHIQVMARTKRMKNNKVKKISIELNIEGARDKTGCLGLYQNMSISVPVTSCNQWETNK